MTRNQEIANTILQQIGGNKFIVMTGAKNFIAIERGIRFNIMRNASSANVIEITLRGDDTYNMRFVRKRNAPNPYTLMAKYLGRGMDPMEVEKKIKKATMVDTWQVLREFKGIYCDQLEEIFRDVTKLNTRLF